MFIKLPMSRFAILTSDFIQFTQLDSGLRMQCTEGIKNLADELHQSELFNWKGELEFFRGDGFQCALASPERALRLALIFRAYLLAFPVNAALSIKPDVRTAIGIGEVSQFRDRLAESDGPAFRFSGRTLDSMSRNYAKLALRSEFLDFDQAFSAQSSLFEAVVRKWSPEQAEVVFYKLQNLTEVQIAQRLQTSQPAVNLRSKNAGWTAIKNWITHFETTVTNFSSYE